MNKITDIKPNSFYKTVAFHEMKYPNGDLVMDDLCKAKKAGKLPYIKKGPAHLLLGSDVAAFLEGKYYLIRTADEAVKEQLKTLTTDEIAKVLHENNFLKERHKEQTRVLKNTLKENTRLREEISHIKRLHSRWCNILSVIWCNRPGPAMGPSKSPMAVPGF